MKLSVVIQMELLGSKAKMAVLEFLLLDGRPSSERELAQRIGLSHMAVNKVMKEFESLGLIVATKIGKSTVWSLNKDSYAYEVAKPLEQFFEKEEPIDALFEMLRDWMKGMPCIKTAYLVGSVAEEREKPDSDIDVLVIAKEGEKETCSREIGVISKEVVEKFGNLFSPLIFEEGEVEGEKWLQKARKKGKAIV